MDKATYIARLGYHENDPDSQQITVFYPDVPGVNTYGYSRDEALAMGKEALENWLETMRDGGEEFSKPNRLDDLSSKPELQLDAELTEGESSHEFVEITAELEVR
jgi:predicted RNase H-like HicB family nuclease